MEIDEVLAKAPPRPWSVHSEYPDEVLDSNAEYVAEIYGPYKAPITQATSTMIVTAVNAFERQREVIQNFLQSYCPSCGCDLFNTSGCSWCLKLRDASHLIFPDKQLAPLLAPDPINDSNMRETRQREVIRELCSIIEYLLNPLDMSNRDVPRALAHAKELP